MIKRKGKGAVGSQPSETGRVKRYGHARNSKKATGQKVRGSGSRKPTNEKQEEIDGSSNRKRGEAEAGGADQAKRPRRTVDQRIRQAERAYNCDTNPKIRKIIQNMEEEAIQSQSDSEMEDWLSNVQDPGNTRGRLSLLKQSLHLYWVMKRLLAKALEQVASEMIEIAQKSPDMRRELQFIHISMEMQERKLDEIHLLLKGDQGENAGVSKQQPGNGEP